MEENEPKYESVDQLKTLRNYVYGDNINYDLMMNEIQTPEYFDNHCNNDDHIVLWLAENTIGHWTSNTVGVYYFEDGRDGMACKLRWT